MSSTVIDVRNLAKRYILGRTSSPLVRAARKGKEALRRSFGRPPRVELDPRRDFWALKDISFQVKHGDVVGIIGRNGAGKSTLLKILAQITPPTRGSVRIEGRVGSILEVGTGFNPALTGRQNVMLSASILGMHEHEVRRRLAEIIDFAGVGQFIDEPVKFYSSGMHARLAFSVVAHLEHEILLIDEVLAVGDAAFQKKCVGKLHGEATSGRTVLFVSHSMASISSLCNRAILISDGQLTIDGTTDEAINTYLEKTTALTEAVDYNDPDRAPGNEALRLRAVRMYGEDGASKLRHRNSDDIFIDIDYWNLREGAKMGATLVVLDPSGVCIFSSLGNHEKNWHGKPRPKGIYRSTVRIPANFMKDGRYSLAVLLWADNYTDQCRFDSVADFEVVDSGILRGDYYGGWEGFVVPKLDWVCTKLD
jgi:lipopolysaccharide transport system ATP-binding protein